MKPIEIVTDELYDVTYILLKEGFVHHTKSLYDEQLLVDFDENNRIMGIEIL